MLYTQLQTPPALHYSSILVSCPRHPFVIVVLDGGGDVNLFCWTSNNWIVILIKGPLISATATGMSQYKVCALMRLSLAKKREFFFAFYFLFRIGRIPEITQVWSGMKCGFYKASRSNGAIYSNYVPMIFKCKIEV